MGKYRYTEEHAAAILQEVITGTSLNEACAKLGVSRTTFHHLQMRFAPNDERRTLGQRLREARKRLRCRRRLRPARQVCTDRGSRRPKKVSGDLTFSN